jgi:nicotinamide mononucleotide transporter
MNTIIEYFSGPLGQLELLATVLLIANVYLLAKQKLLNYWFGLAGVLIYGYLFLQFQLYSDMMLQWLFYAPLQIVGYVMWKYGRTLGEVASAGLDSMKIVALGTTSRLSIIAAIITSAAILGFVMATNTDASFPYIDALTTTMSVAASILLLKKIWENWIIWIAMDLIAIPLYYTKEMYVTSGLYVIFLGLATYGAVTWYREMRAQND